MIHFELQQFACKVSKNQPVITFQAEICPSTSTAKSDTSEPSSRIIPRPPPTLAGACDLTDIKTLLREWVTTITGIKGQYIRYPGYWVFIIYGVINKAKTCSITSCFTLEPMEEDILQVVKYCTDLIEDKDLEKLDLIIKYMKR